jgi:hypothetical protein
MLFRRYEALQLLEPVLDHNDAGGGLVGRDVLLDHQEPLAVGRDIVHPRLWAPDPQRRESAVGIRSVPLLYVRSIEGQVTLSNPAPQSVFGSYTWECS